MFLRLPPAVFEELLKTANAQGKSASVYVVESIIKRLSEDRKNK